MKSTVFLVLFAVTHLCDTEGYSIVENPLDLLNRQIESMEELVIRAESTYCDDMYNHPLPRNYKSTLRRAQAILNRASTVVNKIIKRSCRCETRDNQEKFRKSLNAEEDLIKLVQLSKDDRTWTADFNKALSRVIKEQFRNEPLIQDNLHEGFQMPTRLNSPK